MKHNHPLDGFHKTRLAPTPSGYLHIGNALSFALTASFAALSDASLLLRIDDLDAGRLRPEYISDIFSTLDFLGIHWQEGPADAAGLAAMYSQHLRLPLYDAALEQLLSSGDVFACTCSRAEIEAERGYPGTCRNKKLPLDTPGACWRIRTNPNEKITISLFNGDEFSGLLPASMTDFVIRKKDGMPSYQLASLVDDVFFEVDLVIRGEDLLGSSLGQSFLARRLNYRDYLEAAFFFHPLLSDENGRKLSKSEGDLSVAAMIRKGMSPAELYGIIGETLQLEEETESWEPLADLLLRRMP